MKEDRALLNDCVDKNGPVNVTQTVAKIKVCGRCGYTVAMHTVAVFNKVDPATAYLGTEGDGSLERVDTHPDPPPLRRPGPGRERLG